MDSDEIGGRDSRNGTLIDYALLNRPPEVRISRPVSSQMALRLYAHHVFPVMGWTHGPGKYRRIIAGHG